MNAELTKELKKLFQNTLSRYWEENNKGEYGPLEMYEYAFPPRRADGLKRPSLVFLPVTSEDKIDEEDINIEICACVALEMPKQTSNRDAVETEIARHLVEGNTAVVNLASVLQRTIRANTIVGKRFRFEGQQKWTLIDNNSQPSPFFYAVGRVVYKTVITNKLKLSEVNAYGSKL